MTIRSPRALVVFSLGLLWVLVLRATTSGGDFFDSPMFYWSYLVLPVAAWIGVAIRFETSPISWLLLPAPAMLWVFLEGYLFFNPDNGASFWILGELYLVFLAALVLAAAGIAAVRPPRFTRRTSRSRSPDSHP